MMYILLSIGIIILATVCVMLARENKDLWDLVDDQQSQIKGMFD